MSDSVDDDVEYRTKCSFAVDTWWATYLLIWRATYLGGRLGGRQLGGRHHLVGDGLVGGGLVGDSLMGDNLCGRRL